MKKALVMSLLILSTALYSGDRPDGNALELKRLCERLKTNPADLRTTDALAELFEKRGNWQDACKLRERLVALQPDESRNYADLARCFIKLDRPDKARDVSTNALAYFPANSAVLRSAGSAEFKLGNYSNALLHFRKAFDLAGDREKPWLLVQTGKCRRELKDLAGSRDDLLAALRMKDDPWAFFEYGKTLEALGSDADALWAYRKSLAFAVTEEPAVKEAIAARLAGCHYRLGTALKDAGKKREALAHFRAILEERDLARTKWSEKASFWVKRL